MALRFLHSQFFVTPTYPTTRCDGKTVVVTGSNVGLGKEAARHFTRLGAKHVILAVRSLSKGEAAKEDIESSTGRKDVVRVMQLDMASHASVLEFASQLSAQFERIDIAILNAGVARSGWETFENDESTIAVNVVSTFLLYYALLPKLIASSKKFNIVPTLTVVSSEVHEWAAFTERQAPEGQIFARLNERYVNGKEVDYAERYQVSKLLEVLFVREFVTRHEDAELPLTINFVNPGLCHSEFAREAGWTLWVMKLLLARSTEVGSRTLVHAGTSGQESHGEYMLDCRITPPSEFTLSDEGRETQRRVYDELVKKLEGIKPGITKV